MRLWYSMHERHMMIDKVAVSDVRILQRHGVFGAHVRVCAQMHIQTHLCFFL